MLHVFGICPTTFGSLESSGKMVVKISYMEHWGYTISPIKKTIFINSQYTMITPIFSLLLYNVIYCRIYPHFSSIPFFLVFFLTQFSSILHILSTPGWLHAMYILSIHAFTTDTHILDGGTLRKTKGMVIRISQPSTVSTPLTWGFPARHGGIPKTLDGLC